MSELKAYNVVVTDECADYICGQKQLEFEAYAAEDVDAAIAELKCENERLKKKMDDYHLMSDIRRAKIKELKRALYKACANWALSTLAWLDCIDQGDPRKWSEMRQKCLKKSKENK